MLRIERPELAPSTSANGSSHTHPPVAAPRRAVVPRRGAALVSAVLFGVGAALTDVVAVSRAESPLLGIVLAALGLIQLGAAASALARPTRRRLLAAGIMSLAILAYWAISRFTELLGGPALWLAEDRLAGSTDVVGEIMRLLAALLFLAGSMWRPEPRPRRLLLNVLATSLATVPTLLLAGGLTFADLAMILGSDSPAPRVSPSSAPAGQRTTFTYCTLDGTRLAMDVYEPAAATHRPAPAVLYIHGGAWLYGGRASDGAYFDQMQTALNGRGFVFASIDYGLGSLYAFPVQIQDAECAVRFLRAHANTLGIDPNRIGAWGASFGGTSAALLGMAGTPASWQVGQYLDQSSRVQAVVDMSGATDLASMGQASGVISQVARESLFRVPGSGATASPVLYVGPNEPPFFIVHGTRDPFVPAAQSQELAQRLRDAGSPVRLVLVEGAGHVGMDPRIATQIPAAVDFLSRELASRRNSG